MKNARLLKKVLALLLPFAILVVLAACGATVITPSPADSPTPSPAGSPTSTPSPADTPTPSPADSPSPTPSPTDSPSPSPTPTPTPTPTATPTASPPVTASPSPTDSPVSAKEAANADLSQFTSYDKFTDTGFDPPANILFTTTAAVSKFQFISLTADTSGAQVQYKVDKVLHTTDQLTPDHPLFVTGTGFGGDLISNRGVSFTDASGATRYFYMSLSGLDGSVLLTEFTPVA